METWHPLGVIGVVSAFNFPAAVWSWNTAIAIVCGNAIVWKPAQLALIVAANVGGVLITRPGTPSGAGLAP